MTRPAHLVAADLAANSARRAELETELAHALLASKLERSAPQAPAPAPAEYLTTAEAAALLGVSAGHLKALRAQGAPVPGPEFVRLGRSVRYRRADLEQILSGRDRRPSANVVRANAVRVPSGPGYVALSANGKSARFC